MLNVITITKTLHAHLTHFEDITSWPVDPPTFRVENLNLCSFIDFLIFFFFISQQQNIGQNIQQIHKNIGQTQISDKVYKHIGQSIQTYRTDTQKYRTNTQKYRTKYTNISDKYTKVTDKYTKVTDRYTNISDRWTDISDRWTSISDKCTKITDKCTKISNTSLKYRTHKHTKVCTHNLIWKSSIVTFVTFVDECHGRTSLGTRCLKQQQFAHFRTKILFLGPTRLSIRTSINFISLTRNVILAFFFGPLHPQSFRVIHLCWISALLVNKTTIILLNLVCFHKGMC